MKATTTPEPASKNVALAATRSTRTRVATIPDTTIATSTTATTIAIATSPGGTAVVATTTMTGRTTGITIATTGTEEAGTIPGDRSTIGTIAMIAMTG